MKWAGYVGRNKFIPNFGKRQLECLRLKQDNKTNIRKQVMKMRTAMVNN
jgi:hypothetical protein